MKSNAYDFGTCGVEQMFCAGTVKHDMADLSTGAELLRLPNTVIVTRAVVDVKTAFSAGAVTVGANDGVNNVIASADATATTAGTYSKEKFVKLNRGDTLKVKLSETATAGEADIYLFFVSVPDD